MKSNPAPAEGETHNWSPTAPEKLPLCCGGSEPGDPAEGLGVPREPDPEGQWDLTAGSPQDWGKPRRQFGGRKHNVNVQRKAAVTPREEEPKLPASVGGLLRGVGPTAWVLL